MTTNNWSVAGLCVTARPEDLDSVASLLCSRAGIEVHARDQASGRLIVTQEFETVDDHRRGLEEIQALPGVLTAEFVIHYMDQECVDSNRRTGGVR